LTEILNVIWDFALNVLLAYLVPTALLGIILKVQKRRRVYPTGAEGEKQLMSFCNRGLIGFNALFLVWSWTYHWPSINVDGGLITRSFAAPIFVLIYRNRPLSVIAVPEGIIAAVTWVSTVVDHLLEASSKYVKFKQNLATRLMGEPRLHYFSGGEISRLSSAVQLPLTQTLFTCYSCGQKKEFNQLGEILEVDGEKLYFCYSTPCMVEASNLYAKRLSDWRQKLRGP